MLQCQQAARKGSAFISRSGLRFVLGTREKAKRSSAMTQRRLEVMIDIPRLGQVSIPALSHSEPSPGLPLLYSISLFLCHPPVVQSGRYMRLHHCCAPDAQYAQLHTWTRHIQFRGHTMDSLPILLVLLYLGASSPPLQLKNRTQSVQAWARQPTGKD